MPYYFVCDGGGSKTESLLFDERGRILASAQGRGANALFLPPEQAGRRVLDQMRDTLKTAGLSAGQLHTVALFIPGFRPCEAMVRAALPPQVNLRLEGDDRNAFYGALGSGRGIAVLSGTGSFAIGRGRSGAFAKAGGWGPVMGDEGSGYHIGSLCLHWLGRLADEGRPGSVLEKLVLEHFGKADLMELRSEVSGAGFDRAAVAELCRVTAEAARRGDGTARMILETAASELARLAACVAKKLDDPALPVVLIGGASKAGPALTVPFCRQVKALLPEADCRPPAATPVLGAVLCVLQENAGLDIDDPALLERIRKEAGGNL